MLSIPFPLLAQVVCTLMRKSIHDPRQGKNIQYHLPFLCFAILISEMAGVFTQIEKVNWIQQQLSLLVKTWLELGGDNPFSRAPSQQTLSRLLAMIEAEKLIQEQLEMIKNQICEALKERFFSNPKERFVHKHVIVDGKCRQGITSPETGRTEMDLVFLDAESRAVLDSLTLPEKTGEATGFRIVLYRLPSELGTVVFSFDAGITSRENLAEIVRLGHDYVAAIKTPAGEVYQSCEKVLDWEKAETHREEREESHGRSVERMVSYIPVADLAQGVDEAEAAHVQERFQEYEGLAGVVRVVTVYPPSPEEENSTGKKRKKPKKKKKNKGRKTEVRYFLISKGLEGKTLQEIAQIIRNHWVIENGLHWVKDAILQEDASRVRKASSSQILGFMKSLVVRIGYALCGSVREFVRRFRLEPEKQLSLAMMVT